jgi:hypothetical protein
MALNDIRRQIFADDTRRLHGAGIIAGIDSFNLKLR